MNWKHLSGQKKQNLGGNKREESSPLFCLLWTAVNKHLPGVIAWVLGDRSSKTFNLLWQIIGRWHSYFYVTDGYPVYPCFISEEDHIVSKTYMM